jgi:hypothetical protein
LREPILESNSPTGGEGKREFFAQKIGKKSPEEIFLLPLHPTPKRRKIYYYNFKKVFYGL